jgi:DNA-binding transcriptional LysR family regulator
MNLSPRQLRIFVALAQSLNFSRTADQFFVTQPTLSKIVREIEEEIGVPLFERTTRSVKLTTDGEALVTVAARVTQEFESGVTEFEEVARRRTQRLAIAALPTLAAYVLPAPVAALRAEMPNAVVRIHDVTADEALELLRARKVDLALTGVDVIHKDLAYEEIVRERFVLLSARKHPLGVDVSVWSEEELGALSLISMPRGTGTRQSVEAAFISKGLRFRPFLEFQHLTSIAKFVKTGCGVAVLPLSGAQLVLDRDLVIHSPRGAPERSIGIVTRRDHELPLLAAKMVKSIREHARALGKK